MKKDKNNENVDRHQSLAKLCRHIKSKFDRYGFSPRITIDGYNSHAVAAFAEEGGKGCIMRFEKRNLKSFRAEESQPSLYESDDDFAISPEKSISPLKEHVSNLQIRPFEQNTRESFLPRT